MQRVYVHESIAADFRDRLVVAVEKLKIGHPAEETSQIASLITVEAAERVEQWTRQAAQAGAKIVTGGDRTRATIRPGVLTEVPEDSRFMREELFGPLVAVNASTRSISSGHSMLRKRSGRAASS